MSSNTKKRILVAMSGGVDSSVSALLLQKKGYEVIGITMNFGSFCCNPILVSDARKVAEKLGIEHHVLNCETEFKSNVVDYFIDSYINGETPNPCAKCNREIKFAKLLDFADKLGIEKLATGHYARMTKDSNGEFELRKAFSEKKDQSYFLAMLRKEFFPRIEFPLGEFESKDNVRKIAEENDLFVAHKKDSQDICFIPDDNYKALIEKHVPNSSRKGDVILQDTGKKIGEHNGIINYTIGQRKGLGLAYTEPLYVVRIDKEKNEVFVGTEKYLYSSEVFLNGVNVLGNEVEVGKSLEVFVKLRSAHKGEYATVLLSQDNTAVVKLKNPVKSVTKGQLCVGYVKDKVVFGGWIVF
jgi:tRNA-specific 2-thiouridylase